MDMTYMTIRNISLTRSLCKLVVGTTFDTKSAIEMQVGQSRRKKTVKRRQLKQTASNSRFSSISMPCVYWLSRLAVLMSDI